jgi:hypothetical protein
MSDNTANKNSYQMVVKPLDFEITCTSGGKTIDVSHFNGYVERIVAIPDGAGPYEYPVFLFFCKNKVINFIGGGLFGNLLA